MKKPPNFEKVSVSLPPEVHAWIKAEAQRRTQHYGESWSASRIIQEAIREYRAKQQSHATPQGQAMPDRILLNDETNPPQSGHIVNPRQTSAGGSSTAPTRYPTKRQAKS